jgi:hypothetical protein
MATLQKKFLTVFLYIYMYMFLCQDILSLLKLISEANPDIFIRGGGPFFLEKISDFKAICFKKNQKMPRRNLKRKLQIKVKRKMTKTKLEMFC